MSELESDSHEEEYLMSTRERRSNAGNRMKKLLEQEVDEMQSKTESLNEDDLDLLFQEDAEDEDFEGGRSESEPEDSVDREPIAQVEDEDLVLSDSDEEASDQDEEEGERELQRQEKARHKRKARARPPVLKRKPVGPTDGLVKEAKKKATYELLKAESLLVSDRRTSKRSHVVANKLEIYEKLSLAEKKRKVIQERIKKHKAQQSDETLTQEDRLRIAAETEKFNLLSLNKYKEQEISKKQTRLAMQQRQKMKFKTGEPILQELSTAWLITPAMEVDDKAYWDEQVKKREKRRKKYPRRQSKKQSPGPGSKDDKEKTAGKNEPLSKNESVSGVTTTDNAKVPTNDEKEGTAGEQRSLDVAAEQSEKETTENPGAPADERSRVEPVVNEGIKDEQLVNPANQKKEEAVKQLSSEVESHNVNSGEMSESIQNSHTPGRSVSPDEKEVEPLSEEGSRQVKTEQNPGDSGEDKASKKDTPMPDGLQEDASPSRSNTKKVSFAADTQTEIDPEESNPISAKENSPDQKNGPAPPELTDDTGSEEEQIYQGPPQEVSRNFVTLYHFAADSLRGDVRDEVFGPQWSGSNNQRTANVEKVCKLVMAEGLSGSDEKTNIVPDLSFLESFPAFGEYGKKLVYDVGLNTGKELEIEIKTLPPSGVLFPNGVRKKCFITNKECQYFDPKNGVPYSDVEAYKVIQELQNPLGASTDDDPKPHFQWFGFKNGGIYLDLDQRPAKGVPEGFT